MISSKTAHLAYVDAEYLLLDMMKDWSGFFEI